MTEWGNKRVGAGHLSFFSFLWKEKEKQKEKGRLEKLKVLVKLKVLAVGC